MTNKSLVFSMRSFVVRKCCGYAVKPFVVMTPIPTNTKSAAKALNKRTLEDCGDGPMAKYRNVLDEFINVTSNNRSFRFVHRSVSTYEQTKKGLSYLYPKTIVEVDGFHTRPLNL